MSFNRTGKEVEQPIIRKLQSYQSPFFSSFCPVASPYICEIDGAIARILNCSDMVKGEVNPRNLGTNKYQFALCYSVHLNELIYLQFNEDQSQTVKIWHQKDLEEAKSDYPTPSFYECKIMIRGNFRSMAYSNSKLLSHPFHPKEFILTKHSCKAIYLLNINNMTLVEHNLDKSVLEGAIFDKFLALIFKNEVCLYDLTDPYFLRRATFTYSSSDIACDIGVGKPIFTYDIRDILSWPNSNLIGIASTQYVYSQEARLNIYEFREDGQLRFLRTLLIGKEKPVILDNQLFYCDLGPDGHVIYSFDPVTGQKEKIGAPTQNAPQIMGTTYGLCRLNSDNLQYEFYPSTISRGDALAIKEWGTQIQAVTSLVTPVARIVAEYVGPRLFFKAPIKQPQSEEKIKNISKSIEGWITKFKDDKNPYKKNLAIELTKLKNFIEDPNEMNQTYRDFLREQCPQLNILLDVNWKVNANWNLSTAISRALQEKYQDKLAELVTQVRRFDEVIMIKPMENKY